MADNKLVVLGAGPGGYAAAFLAADRGMQVTLVDADAEPGGVCLHRGCIPSKALLHLAKLIEETRAAKHCGLDFGEPRIDLEQIRSWKSGVIEKMTGGLNALCKQRNVVKVQGRGVLRDANTLAIAGGETLNFDRCIVATGSSPLIPRNMSDAGVWDSTAALKLDAIPERLLVVGGGYIGLELGTVYAALGSRVTVAELTDGLLPGVDRELVRPLQTRLKRNFASIHLNTRVTAMKKQGSTIHAEFDGEAENASFDAVLVAIGRQPNSSDLGLENTQARVNDRGFIEVDANGRTADPSIYAIGDVAGGMQLAHKATADAKAAVDAIANGGTREKPPVIPAVVFTDPEIAWCGLTATEAKEQGRDVQLARFPWSASGKAQILGRGEGLTQWVVEPETGKVLGAGIVGAGAGDLISEAVLAVELGANARDIAHSVHPHPTVSETLMEAAETFGGQAIHIYKRPRR